MRKHYSVEHFREAVWKYLDENGISQTRLANSLDIAQRGLNRFLIAQGGISLDHAILLMNYIEYEPEEIESDISDL